MNTKKCTAVFLAAGLSILAAHAAFVPETIHYQGRLINGTNLVNGSVTVEFLLYGGVTGGTPSYHETQTVVAVDGLFSTGIGASSPSASLRSVFLAATNQLWLELRANGNTLSPREPVAAVAYAFNIGQAWGIEGNDDMVSGKHFLGTRNNVELELRANNLRALTIYPNIATPNIIAGHRLNSFQAGAVGTVIAGGGTTIFPNFIEGNYGFLGSGLNNRMLGYAGVLAGGKDNIATGTFGVVAGGATNSAKGSGAAVVGGLNNRADQDWSFVGGGRDNAAAGESSSVGGGSFNVVTGAYSAVAGGDQNRINAEFAFIGGGQLNVVTGDNSSVAGGLSNDASGQNAAIGGGWFNRVTGNSGTVGGGFFNSADGGSSSVSGGDNNIASGDWSFVGGGNANQAAGSQAAVAGGSGNLAGTNAFVGGGVQNDASGPYAMIVGGQANSATAAYSFAAGREAGAVHEGAFVWADAVGTSVTSTASNQWTVRSSGGARFYSDAAATIGVELIPGASSWSATSDRSLKENITPVDPVEVLDRLDRITVSRWNFRGHPPEITQMGPMAQDFEGAFGFGGPETSINSLNADGVSMAAIQGLYRMVKELQAENTALKKRMEALEGAGQTP